MLLKNISIFKLFGFDIRFDISWLFLAILIFNTFSSYVLPGLYPGHTATTYHAMATGSLVALMISIIAHELGHALVAQRYRIPIDYIVLYIFGGIAQMKGALPHPRADFLLAIAGPVMSALMSVLFYMGGHFITILPTAAAETFLFMGYINALLFASNMIPAYPLDGGRVLRALLWHIKKDFVWATRTTAYLGYLFSYALMAYGVYLLVHVNDLVSGVWYIVMGLFMHSATTNALKGI